MLDKFLKKTNISFICFIGYSYSYILNTIYTNVVINFIIIKKKKKKHLVEDHLISQNACWWNVGVANLVKFS